MGQLPFFGSNPYSNPALRSHGRGVSSGTTSLFLAALRASYLLDGVRRSLVARLALSLAVSTNF